MKKTKIILISTLAFTLLLFLLLWSTPSKMLGGSGARTPFAYLNGDNTWNGENTFNGTTTLENGFVSTTTPTQAGQILGLDGDGNFPISLFSTGDNATTTGKVLNTWYQNTSGRPIVVHVSGELLGDYGQGGASITMQIGLATTSPMSISGVSVCSSCDNSLYRPYQLTVIVPNNYYYKATQSGVADYWGLSIWSEYELY